MTRDRAYFLLLNIGHFLDHLFMLIFATVAALALHREWGLGYAALLAYATPGFFAFGVFALPAGWLADRWSRDGMMAVFFIGIGMASILTGYAQTPLQIGIGLFVVGMFAAIYHPVGLAIVTMKWRNMGMRIAANGVWGNLGVASAALITGYLIDHGGWRLAFILPGIFSIAMGLAYMVLRWDGIRAEHQTPPARAGGPGHWAMDPAYRRLLLRVTVIVFVTTAVSSVIFQSTTFALPKMLDERLSGLARDIALWLGGAAQAGEGGVATAIGALTFIVFAAASTAQLAVGVMLGAFGQIPINDFMIGKMASGPARARIYGIRYVVSFSVLAASLPMIAVIYDNWGFDTLFLVLASAAFVILCAVVLLPRHLPSAAPVPAAAE